MVFSQLEYRKQYVAPLEFRVPQASSLRRIADSKIREFNAKAQRREDKTISTTKSTKKHESGTVLTTEDIPQSRD